VSGAAYDRFGDFESFLLETQSGEERRFDSREQDIEDLVVLACRDWVRIRVFVSPAHPHRPSRIVLLRTPRIG
jgi:hypothetical protein